jgi:flavin-dependent dehydrogenase
MKRQFDVAIVGAGIAGSHLAQLLAAHNFNILLIDQRPLMGSGPNWINGIPSWIFDKAKVKRPQKPEIFDENDRFIIRANNRNRLVINKLGLLDVHMERLGIRLKQDFLKCNNSNFLMALVKGSNYINSRLTEIDIESKETKIKKIKAHLFVDASGIKATLRKGHPLGKPLWPNLERQDTCIAAQVSYEIKDRHGAISYLEKNQTLAGDILCDIGFMGGYSLFRSQVDHDLNHISVLCGVRALPHYKSALTAVRKFEDDNSWIGQRFIAGQGAIPLNSPYHQLGDLGLALLGDAASQVYAAHGSGIGMGLLAATILCDALIDARKTGTDLGSLSVINAYQKVFHGLYQKRLYFAEQFRRFSQSITLDKSAQLIDSGLLNEELMKQTLRQEDLSLPLKTALSLTTKALLSPKALPIVFPLIKNLINDGHKKSTRINKGYSTSS